MGVFSLFLQQLLTSLGTSVEGRRQTEEVGLAGGNTTNGVQTNSLKRLQKPLDRNVEGQYGKISYAIRTKSEDDREWIMKKCLHSYNNECQWIAKNCQPSSSQRVPSSSDRYTIPWFDGLSVSIQGLRQHISLAKVPLMVNSEEVLFSPMSNCRYDCKMCNRSLTCPSDCVVHCYQHHPATFDLLSKAALDIPNIYRDCKNAIEWQATDQNMSTSDCQERSGSMPFVFDISRLIALEGMGKSEFAMKEVKQNFQRGQGERYQLCLLCDNGKTIRNADRYWLSEHAKDAFFYCNKCKKEVLVKDLYVKKNFPHTVSNENENNCYYWTYVRIRLPGHCKFVRFSKAVQYLCLRDLCKDSIECDVNVIEYKCKVCDKKYINESDLLKHFVSTSFAFSLFHLDKFEKIVNAMNEKADVYPNLSCNRTQFNKFLCELISRLKESEEALKSDLSMKRKGLAESLPQTGMRLDSNSNSHAKVKRLDLLQPKEAQPILVLDKAIKIPKSADLTEVRNLFGQLGNYQSGCRPISVDASIEHCSSTTSLPPLSTETFKELLSSVNLEALDDYNEKYPDFIEAAGQDVFKDVDASDLINDHIAEIEEYMKE